MSHLAYVRSCMEAGLPSSVYDGVPYPHPYLMIWMECRRNGSSLTGGRCLPEPDKGILDQDAELLLACETLDELMEAIKEREEQQARVRSLAREQFGGSSGDGGGGNDPA